MADRHADQLLAGPRLSDIAIYHNDHRHMLIMKGRIVPLTRTEYTLTMILLRKVEQVQASSQGGRMNFFVPMADLLQAAYLSRETLRQHIRNASVKLAPYGVTLAAVGSYGYTAVFLGEPEVERESQQVVARF